jgi:hypothetical protein
VRTELDVFAEHERAHELFSPSSECLTHFWRIDPCYAGAEQLVFRG